MPLPSSLRRIAGLSSWLRRRATVICVASLVAAVALAAVARRLELRTDLTELLPADHPAVRALRTVSPRQRSASNLVLLIESTCSLRSAAFADALRPRLEALVPDTLTAIDWGPDPEPAEYAARWRWLYASLGDLDEVERLADALVARRTQPAYVDLDGEDPAEALSALEARMQGALPRRPATARFQSDDGRMVGVRVWRGREGLGGAGDHETLRRVQAAIAATGPERFGADLRVRFSGPIAQAIEEQEAIRDDLSIATLACAGLVLGALWLAFGSVALVLCALWPTVLGLLAALAIAAGALGSLNLNTAFLASIILGNGINAPILLLAELRRGMSGGRSLRWALPRAALRSIRGVAAAMLAAAAAYGVLGATRFRGFRQFGLVGAAGMIAVLIATYLALPAVIVVIDRRGWLRVGRDRWSPAVSRAWCWLTPARATVIAAALTLAAVVGVVRFARAPIEWDLSKLRSTQSEAARLWDTMEALGMGSVGAGYIANTAVLLVDDAADADRVAAALRAQDAKGDRLIATVRTLASLLPTDQAPKLEALGRLRRRIDRMLERHGDLLSADELRRLHDARPPDGLRTVVLDDLPRKVREAFTEIDGTRGRLIGIDADGKRYHDWDGHTLLRLSRALTVEVDGKRHVAAAAATVFAGMLETLIADAPRLAGLALLAVALLLALSFRGRAGAVIGSLVLGLCWLLGAAGLFGLRLNFMSFAALPISIGVGADYAANLWSRAGSGLTAVAPIVVLCSATTVIGYSSLLIGHNGALRSFGLLCDVGELTCLLAALVSVRVLARRSV